MGVDPEEVVVNTSEIELSSDMDNDLQAASESSCVEMLNEAEGKSRKQEVFDETQYRKTKSKASCKISDIEGFIYGPNSSRFWMLRKHINSVDVQPSVPLKLPFYAWECLTLQLKHRDIDLVI